MYRIFNKNLLCNININSINKHRASTISWTSLCCCLQITLAFTLLWFCNTIFHAILFASYSWPGAGASSSCACKVFTMWQGGVLTWSARIGHRSKWQKQLHEAHCLSNDCQCNQTAFQGTPGQSKERQRLTCGVEHNKRQPTRAIENLPTSDDPS